MSPMSSQAAEFEQKIVIVGVGLIGGSIAAAVQQRYPGTVITGVGRNSERLQLAQDAGLITNWSVQPTAELLQDACVIVCLPVGMVAQSVNQLSDLAGPNTLITDAGSVKAAICSEVNTPKAAQFVPAHPIAGGELGGFEHSDAGLFEGKLCVMTPTNADAEFVERADRFWKAIGCRTTQMRPEEHDTLLSLTSHVPHVMAAVTTNVVGNDRLEFTGSGFRDTTRIAAGGSELWTQILLNNASAVCEGLRSAEDVLRSFRAALEAADAESVQSLLEEAAATRRKLDE